MSQYTLPFRPKDTSPKVSKVTSSHLDSLYSATILFLNLHTKGNLTGDLIGILSALHNQLIARVDTDAAQAISLYKLLSAYFLAVIRGDKPMNKSAFKLYDWDLQANCPVLMVGIINWIASVQGTAMTEDDRWRHYQAIYSILSGHRVIVTSGSPNYSTITDKGLDFYPVWDNLGEALKRLNITPEEFQEVYKQKCASASFKVITTAGPNGQATWSAHLDAEAMLNSQLFSKFVRFAENSNLGWMVTSLSGCVTPPENIFSGSMSAPVLGKIHAIEEWGGKTRLVAILDYWTQSLFTPLHETIAYFLARLDTDGTFDQGKIIAKVRDWTSLSANNVYSYDLTAATDRLPIKYQVDILSYLLGNSELAEDWKCLLSHREFMCPDGSFRKYAVGQPMGAKSSFPMLGLLHHVIVQRSAIAAQVANYNDYVVLGDDNTHNNPRVAAEYLKIMESIGVPINLSKSVYAKKGITSAGEICKRTFVGGRELTALPAKLIVKVTKYGHMAPNLWNVLHARGDPVLESNLLQYFAGLLSKKDLLSLLVLNKVPLSVSGLDYQVQANSELDYSSWFGNIKLDDSSLLHAHSYALVTEQLKRVDSLLRATTLMSETIALMVNKDPAKTWPTELYAGLSPEARAAALKKLPELQWSHPIVLASQNELDRVLSYLSGIRSGSPEMVRAARFGLLDLLRNSLAEIWMDETEKAGAVSRSIFNSMMAALNKMDGLKVAGNQTRALTFSLLLASVARMWSVHWVWGKNIAINVVKSRVNTSVVSTQASITEALKDVDLSRVRL